MDSPTEQYNRHLRTHADHRIAAPLSEDSVRRLLARAMAGYPAPRLLDLGCAEGGWLRHALLDNPRARAVGVDLGGPGLARGETDAARLGVADRLRLVQGDVRDEVPPGPYDVVLCVGAIHAYDGLLPAIRAASRQLAPGGVLMVGDGFWEREPGAAALAALGTGPEVYDTLAGTVDQISAEGWLPVYGHVSTRAEWDEYEWSWTGSLTRWALDHPEHPAAADELTAAIDHRTAWLRGYRDTLGFVTLVLRRR